MPRFSLVKQSFIGNPCRLHLQPQRYEWDFRVFHEINTTLKLVIPEPLHPPCMTASDSAVFAYASFPLTAAPAAGHARPVHSALYPPETAAACMLAWVAWVTCATLTRLQQHAAYGELPLVRRHHEGAAVVIVGRVCMGQLGFEFAWGTGRRPRLQRGGVGRRVSRQVGMGNHKVPYKQAGMWHEGLPAWSPCGFRV